MEEEQPQDGAAAALEGVLALDQQVLLEELDGPYAALNQTRQPKENDIIAYWNGAKWITARVLEKVPPYYFYYHIELEDCIRDGLYLKPKSKNKVHQWTPDSWRDPIDNHLRDKNKGTSRQITPMCCYYGPDNPHHRAGVQGVDHVLRRGWPWQA